MKTTNESYLNRIKRVSILSKFSRYKLNKNSKIDFNSAIKEFNKTTDRLEYLYLSKEERKHKNWVKRYLLVKTFTFKMKNKIVSTVPVILTKQEKINLEISILKSKRKLERFELFFKYSGFLNFTIKKITHDKHFDYFVDLNNRVKQESEKIYLLKKERNLLIAS